MMFYYFLEDLKLEGESKNRIVVNLCEEGKNKKIKNPYKELNRERGDNGLFFKLVSKVL